MHFRPALPLAIGLLITAGAAAQDGDPITGMSSGTPEPATAAEAIATDTELATPADDLPADKIEAELDEAREEIAAPATEETAAGIAKDLLDREDVEDAIEAETERAVQDVTQD